MPDFSNKSLANPLKQADKFIDEGEFNHNEIITALLFSVSEVIFSRALIQNGSPWLDNEMGQAHLFQRG